MKEAVEKGDCFGRDSAFQPAAQDRIDFIENILLPTVSESSLFKNGIENFRTA